MLSSLTAYGTMLVGLLLVASTVLPASVESGLVKVPKIYNALISTDENLTPSRAYPIVEPVFRTTALGVAFPPLLINDRPREGEEIPKKEEKEVAETAKKDVQLSYHGTLYPVTYDPFFHYAYGNEYLFPALPYVQPRPVYVDMKQAEKKPEKEEIAPAVNFEKNPEIPDVPPPPIPFREKEKEKAKSR